MNRFWFGLEQEFATIELAAIDASLAGGCFP